VNEGPKYVSLRDYLRVVRAHRVLIVLIALLFGGVAYALSHREANRYEAEAALSFLPPTRDASLIGTPADASQTPQERAAVNAEAVHAPDVAPKVKRQLKKTKLTAPQIAGSVSARVESRTNLVVITANSGSAKLAADIANAYARVISKKATDAARGQIQRAVASLTRSLKKKSAKGTSPAALISRSNVEQQISRLEALQSFSRPVQIVRSATVPGSPVSPRPVRNGLLGLLVGLTIGLLIAFLRDALDRRVRNAQDISEQLDAPVLGHVNARALGRAGFAGGGRGPLRAEEMEAFRILRMNLEFLDVDRKMRSILVTSPLPEEGKSTVAASLAWASAVAGKRTLLIECDMRRSSLAKRLELAESPGLSDLLAGKASRDEVMRPIRVLGEASTNGGDPGDDPAAQSPKLVCLPAGTPAPRPAEMLGSQRFKDFFREAVEEFDLVVVDSPPLLSVVDARELIPCVDAVLLCIRASRTTSDQAAAGKDAVDRFPNRSLGIVVTGLKRGEGPDYGAYSGAYAYGRERAKVVPWR
jgi:Mrp family chromosome partitioning ATPase/capsular polysaccharide biosynthesis protein